MHVYKSNFICCDANSDVNAPHTASAITADALDVFVYELL